jgi:hypothetical protein
MTPKEKADEIVNTYYIKLHCSKGYYDIENARLCAIIAVNEILKAVGEINWPKEKEIDFTNYFDYWKEVKYEVENLPA